MINLFPTHVRQKAFRKRDGIAHKPVSIQVVMENRTKNVKPLSLASRVLKKLFIRWTSLPWY